MPSVRRILILASNPLNSSRLRLDEEVREIDDVLHRAKQRHRFDIKTQPATRPSDIQQALLDDNPQIVHFCGHGDGPKGLVFEDDQGGSQLVSAQALANLFELFADQVNCVVLNACYSEVQAEVIVKHIYGVIGMNQPIVDQAAIRFAKAPWIWNPDSTSNGLKTPAPEPPLSPRKAPLSSKGRGRWAKVRC